MQPGSRPEDLDYFGLSLASGDFDGEGFADLAVGGPGEDFRAIANAGAVNVIDGSSIGLTAARQQLWTQDSPGILDASEPGDQFCTAHQTIVPGR